MSHPKRPNAQMVIDLTLDPGSFESWDSPIDVSGYSQRYQEQVAAAKSKAGTDEAIVTGAGTINGRRVALLVGEFHFLGGSIGRAAAARVVAAVERASAEELPLIAAPASGGTRMQEGAPAFVEMISISRAVANHKAAGLPYLVYLRHPTTGGVFASWGSQGHFTVGEPGALIGFLGPRVYEHLYGKKFPEGVQVAENLVENGIIDGCVPLPELASLFDRVLSLLTPNRTPEAREPRFTELTEQRTPVWDSVLATRAPERPGIQQFLRWGADDMIPLSGTGSGERGDVLFLGLASFEGIPCVVIGQDRSANKPEGPHDLRQGRRGMRLAEELGLPLVAVVDTPGAELSREAEEGGIAGEISRSLADKAHLSVPTVSVLYGQGGGGAALALLPADRIIAAENSWLSPLPPEGASVIVYHDMDHAAEMAENQNIAVCALQEAGFIDLIVAEEPEASQDVQKFAQAMASATAAELRELIAEQTKG